MKAVIRFFRRYQAQVLFGFLLVFLYFSSRLVNLTLLPIFTDEAIYIRWGQLGVDDAAFRLYSLVDGKQPMLIWMFLPALKVFSDPLFAGRFVSVITGFFGMVGFGILGWYSSGRKNVGYIASFLYIISPFFLTYDRLALYDALIATFTVWSLFLSMVLVKTLRLDSALLLGIVIGGGLLTKSSAQFFIYLLPFSLLLFDWKKKNALVRLGKFGALAVVASGFGFLFTFIMRLSPLYHTISQKNHTFIFSFSEFFNEPFQAVFGNLQGMTSWLVTYVTIPVFILFIIATFWLLRKKFRQTLYFVSWFAVPFGALAFFGRVIYPRFILFMSIPLFIIFAQALSDIWTKKKSIYLAIILIVFFGYSIYFNSQIIFNPVNAPFPYADNQQFLNDWPSGFGVRETVEFFRQESKKGKIVVGTEGTFGLFPYAFELYLGKNPNVEFRAYWPVGEVPEDLLESAKEYSTYLVFKERQDVPKYWPLKLIHEYRRGKGDTFLRVYQVKTS